MIDAPLVILCGGTNSRLGPLSQTIYKPFLELQGSTIVAKYVERARREGIGRVCVVVDEPDRLVSRLLDSIREQAPGLELTEVLVAGTPEDKIRAALLAPGLVSFGDTFAWFGFRDLVERGRSADSALVVGEYRSPFGHVGLSDGLIRSFVEKPAEPALVNLGQMYLGEGALELLAAGMPLAAALARLAAEGRLAALEGSPREFLTVDTIAEAMRADLAGFGEG